MSEITDKSRRRIEAEFASGASVRDIAQRHGLSKSAVGRLRKSMGKRLAEMQVAGAAERVAVLLETLGKISVETWKVYKACVKEKDYSTALRALARSERQLHTLAWLLGQSAPVEVVNLAREQEMQQAALHRIMELLAEATAADEDLRARLVPLLESAAAEPMPE
jgi:hypothetical protein